MVDGLQRNDMNRTIRGRRITIDIDRKENDTDKTLEAKKQKALELIKTYPVGAPFDQNIEIRTSPSGEGYHLIGWSTRGLFERELHLLRKIAGDDSISEDSMLYWKENGKLRYTTIKKLYFSHLAGKKIEVLSAKIKEKNCNNRNLRCKSTTPYMYADWTEITDCWSRGKKKVYLVELNNGKKIKITENHSLIGFPVSRGVTNALQPIALKELTTRAVIANQISPIIEHDSSNLPSEYYTLYGLWLADGCYDSGRKVKISTGGDKDILFWLSAFTKKFYNQEIYVSKSRRGDITIGKKSLLEQMKKDGLQGDSYTKRVPEFMFVEKNENIALFLKGYFSGDGCLSLNHKCPMASSTSVSEKLTEGISTLCNKLGVETNIYSYRDKSGFSKKEINQYILHIFGQQSVDLFMKTVGFIKQYPLEKTTVKKIKRTVHEFTPRKIRKITEFGEEEVYDIEVKPTETFIAQGILCHNSMRIYLDEYGGGRMQEVLFTEKTKVKING